MDCTECGVNSATPVTVEYTTGRTEELTLCSDCLAEFEDGGFVQRMST